MMASASRSSHHNSQRRPPSPLRTLSASHDALNTQSRNAISFQQNGEWVEPPLRSPVPSFQDHPGTSRHGVLETMMPLGTLPTARVKARPKGDPLRRVVQARNLGGLIVDEGRATPEAGAVSDSTRAGSLRTEGRSLRGSPTVDPALEGEEPTSPRAQSSTNLHASNNRVVLKAPQTGQQTTPPSHSPVKQARQETPGSRTLGAFTHSPVPAGSPYFTAAALAKRNGSPEVQPPLAFLYSSAENDPELSRLLHAAVNDGSINNPDSLLYRKIKQVKKAYRSQNSSPRSRAGSTTAARGASGAESSRTDTTRNSVSPSAIQNTTNTIGLATHNNAIHRPHTSALKIKLNVHPTSSASNDTSASRHVSPPKESVEKSAPHPQSEPLSRRSSTSSLSSADSEVLNQPPPAMDIPSTKRSSAERDIEDLEVESARKRLRRNIPNPVVTESNIRNPPSVATRISNSLRSATRPTTPSLTNNTLPDALAGDRQTNGDESLTSGKRSRPETPTALGRPPKKQKTAPRTKVSPVKKQKKIAVAGVARLDRSDKEDRSDTKLSVAGKPREDSESSDNSNYCSACGGPGYLICCDGCDRSFHFSCLEPPYQEGDHVEGDWFCPSCKAQREPNKKPPLGLFSELLHIVEKNNPTSFSLPEVIKGRFKNVTVGEDGEFLDDPDTRPIPSQSDGPNYKSLHDSKGNTILCHNCGKSSGGTRDIIPCDYCGLYWHLDCLNPPLASAPSRVNFETKKRNAWMCPHHADHALRNLDPFDRSGLYLDGEIRSHRLRRPKQTTVVQTHLRRGLANNGMIEVESESSDDSGFESEEDLDGVIYKLPRKGIKLDFIHKVKMNRQAEEQRMRESAAALKASTLGIEAENARKLSNDIRTRQLRERQAAFNLVQFKTNNADLNLNDDEMQNLIMTLESEVPPEVIAQMMGDAEMSTTNTDGKVGERGLPSPPASSSVLETNGSGPSARQRQLLLRMQEHIASLLAAGTNEI